jgi:hypothetical protein
MSSEKVVIFYNNRAAFNWLRAYPIARNLPFEGYEVDAKNSSEMFQKAISNPSVKIVMAQSCGSVKQIRETRKDIFLVGFLHGEFASESDQYIHGLNYCKSESCNLVYVYDDHNELNMVVVPEEARYHVGYDYLKSLNGVFDLIDLRHGLTFTRSTVKPGNLVPWNDSLIPDSLRTVVNYCIKKNAYKPFRGVTAGHFAVKTKDGEFLTSVRGSNFNELPQNGLVRVITDGLDKVISYGAKPSVGGQSQRIIFDEHKGYDCIVHFHSPLKSNSKVPVANQYPFECGSHECGENTSRVLQPFGPLKAGYLDNHGPNIIFKKDTDPQTVINFIEENFDLSDKTGGLLHEV